LTSNCPNRRHDAAGDIDLCYAFRAATQVRLSASADLETRTAAENNFYSTMANIGRLLDNLDIRIKKFSGRLPRFRREIERFFAD
jgi:hypothetical protein